jgi:cyclopropane fatty-acyl-phospholipid synthase-like methyltransferase
MLNRATGDERTQGSTEEWRALAREDDVLYNILAWPGMRGRWTEERFYAAGQSDWEDFRHHWRHYWPELGGTCVEIGCGAGRMSRALAGDFDRVLGLDVSADMIERARKSMPDNVELHQVEEPAIPAGDGEVDAVFSVHVLQHLDSFEAVRRYLAEARRALRPGGSMMVHITLQSRPLPLWRRARIELDVWRSRRGLRQGRKHSFVRMRLYQPEQIEAALHQLGFERVELRVFAVRWNGYRHHFWLASAPG